MRISASTKSKYYDEKLLGAVVYLDGIKVEDAVETDDIEGWVIHLKKNKDGAIHLVYADGTEAIYDGRKRAKDRDEGKEVPEVFIAEEKLYGKVEIKIEKED